MNTAETVERVVAPVLSTLGIELVDVESHPGHLRVTIDRSSGLDLAAISQATTAVSHALDEADAVPGGRYELEVSSPGLERRLRRPEHFARFVGTEIAVRLRPGVAEDGERRVEGQLVAADEAGIELELASPGGKRRIRYGDLERAHTIFDWRAALASAPSTERANRRQARPSAAERSRAAAAARTAGAAHTTAEPATSPAATDNRRRPSTTSNDRTRRQATTTDDDRHVTETP
ncbi:MAG: ribosome maturation factor RimP [Acidimicrobiales bacterium]|jgi:ribosome maturation factor RimP